MGPCVNTEPDEGMQVSVQNGMQNCVLVQGVWR